MVYFQEYFVCQADELNIIIPIAAKPFFCGNYHTKTPPSTQAWPILV